MPSNACISGFGELATFLPAQRRRKGDSLPKSLLDALVM